MSVPVVCVCVYLWLQPLPPLLGSLLHLAEKPQQEVATPHLALTGGVKVLRRKQEVKEAVDYAVHLVYPTMHH